MGEAKALKLLKVKGKMRESMNRTFYTQDGAEENNYKNSDSDSNTSSHALEDRKITERRRQKAKKLFKDSQERLASMKIYK